MKQYCRIHTLHLWDNTEELLWHHKLFYTWYQYLYNTRKYIYGVPKFSDSNYKVLDQWTTWIQANFYKTPHLHGTTLVATQPYQVLLIEFPLSWMNSDENDQNTIYEGINAETFWILITYHFTGMRHVDAIISKASYIDCLRNSLNQYSTNCNGTYIHMVKGGEHNHLFILYILLDLILLVKMGQLKKLITH